MLKRLLSISISLLITLFALANPALAGDAGNGAKIFNANCAACHSGGNNLVNATKTLKKDALEKYGMYSAEAVIAQVTNGKNAMPSFKGRLNDQQIEDVAAYVISQADKGW
ncbi:Cytochrome c6 [Stanieria cyanosphaera PCC 7437]|uniref:Cytochrome c6 n=1 Tax=Stanieria cyanosphaera (strain ATCC 29371 / PCC 7437) TaxID=111780 RepID=K9XTZ9_STAC7|nr:Cytochrome c6 [Stanieria cyanosphaera PCC 7437]